MFAPDGITETLDTGQGGGRGHHVALPCFIDLSYKKIIKAPKGENGKGSNKYGKNAEDVIICVPEGTTIIDLENNEVIERLCDNTLDVGLWLVLVLIKNSHLFLFIQVR